MECELFPSKLIKRSGLEDEDEDDEDDEDEDDDDDEDVLLVHWYWIFSLASSKSGDKSCGSIFLLHT